MKLINSNPAPEMKGEDILITKSNYFIGNDKEKWRTNIARVRYKEVYPGIDLIYYGNQRKLEYDLIVSPGSDPGIIQLAFEGADEITIDAQGNLVLHTPGGKVIQQAPIIYQEAESSLLKEIRTEGVTVNCQLLTEYQAAIYC